MGKKLRWRVLLILLVVVGADRRLRGDGVRARQERVDGPGRADAQGRAEERASSSASTCAAASTSCCRSTRPTPLKAERDDAVETLKSQAQGRRARRRRAADRHVVLGRRHAADRPDQARGAAKRFLPDWNYSTAGGKWTFALKDVARRADGRQRRLPGRRDDPQPRRRVRRLRAADRARGPGPDPRPAARDRRSQARQGPHQEHRVPRALARRDRALDRRPPSRRAIPAARSRRSSSSSRPRPRRAAASARTTWCASRPSSPAAT